MTVSSAEADFDNVDELTGAINFNYIYVCKVCNVRTETTLDYPRVVLRVGSEEPFAVVPAQSQ
jgi:hypothetical protein